MRRAYTQRRRAASVEDTRRRITEAAVRLHGTIGPARTTISAIAAEAGVERLTVYRHFADEAAIFAACSAHWIAAHPPPDPDGWAGQRGANAVEAALTALYAYYEQTHAMWRLVYRDADVVPAMAAPFAGWQDYLAQVCRGLGTALDTARPARPLAAALAHVVAFPTWDAFASRGVTRTVLVRLMAGLVADARDGGRQAQRPPRGAAAGAS